ncbi:uncharacterized protein LOC130444188 [Diorhabda sublineata]|uniref:uncharacterized protein LOC130444188 n=1 Tax=Diorhabda sublineata TaxID=1163346 RepID=UPI0024E0F2D1|nr:uncharacterized protein LOC130444188 [Diorhabda sublineata]
MAFMKHNPTKLRSKKTKVFNMGYIYQFLKDAQNFQYLMRKVAAIFGIARSCRRDELKKLSIEDIEEVDSILILEELRSKTDKERSFVIRDEVEEGLNLIDIYQTNMNFLPIIHLEIIILKIAKIFIYF